MATARAGRRRELAEQIVQISHRLMEQGLQTGGGGNISARLSETEILITRTNVRKSDLTVDDVLVVDYGGNLVEGDGRPSKEVHMHLAGYIRPEIHAVIHCHAAISRGFATAHFTLDRPWLPEIESNFGGRVPVVPYFPAGSRELADACRALTPQHNGLLLANHGVLVLGTDLENAFKRVEVLESNCLSLLVAHLLGGAREIPAQWRK